MCRRSSFVNIKELIHKGMYVLKEPDVIDNTFTCFSEVRDYKTCIFDFEHPINYFEAQIVNNTGNCRIGFASKNAELLGPLGYDQYGYSYTSKNGYGVHKSKRIRFGERLTSKDFISCYLRRSNFHTTLHFFVNGVEVNKSFKVAYNLQGNLFPALALHNFCEISINFGPFFAYEEKVKGSFRKIK